MRRPRQDRRLREKAARLVQDLRPADDVYGDYLEQAERYSFVHLLSRRSVSKNGRETRIEHLDLVDSAIFGRKYLVAYLPKSWLDATSPGLNAIMSVMAEDGRAVAAPPLVMVPSTRRGSRSRGFAATLEHEFVHVNQALQGRLHDSGRRRSVARLANGFFREIRMEYEASFLEFVNWPNRRHLRYDLTVDHFALVKGYGQALEALLRRAADMGMKEPTMMRLLDQLGAALPAEIAAMGAEHGVPEWFAGRWQAHVTTAVMNILERTLEMRTTPTFQGVGRWLKARVPPAGSEHAE